MSDGCGFMADSQHAYVVRLCISFCTLSGISPLVAEHPLYYCDLNSVVMVANFSRTSTVTGQLVAMKSC